jgi:hypothetical protein
MATDPSRRLRHKTYSHLSAIARELAAKKDPIRKVRSFEKFILFLYHFITRLHITSQKLGEGEFGVVFKGFYNLKEEQWTPVAVKQIKEDVLMNTTDMHLTNCLKELGKNKFET